jgi:NADPH:quinone reductase-like Zn-dependent oxidoreductase
VSTTPESWTWFCTAGAVHVIDYTEDDFTRNGQRYDLILDIAVTPSVSHFRRSLGPGGRYVLVPAPWVGSSRRFWSEQPSR